jgi:hypothetical protein
LFDDLDNTQQNQITDNTNELATIGNWTNDQPDYYNKTEVDTLDANTNTSMKNYVDAEDTNLQPELCGVAYFSSLGNPTELTRITSLEYNNNSLYIGITNYGIKKIDFSSVLFKHCK